MNKQNDHDVCISGVGIVSVFGDTLDDFIKGINNDKSESTYITDEHILKNIQIPVFKASFQTEFEDPESRILSMGKKAICDALKDRNSDHLPNINRICLIVGSGMGFVDQFYYDENKRSEPDYFGSLAEKLSEITELNCEAIYIGNACAAGSQAISYGMDLLKSNRYDLVIAGGIDILSQAAYAGFLRLNAIDSDGCKPFDRRRKGIAIGEGTVFYVLERRNCIELNGNIYCSLPGSGVTCDAYHIVQMNPDGKEAIRAMDQALSFSGFEKKDVDLIVAHGTGTTQNDKIESQMINKYFEKHTNDMYVTAPKGAIGHTGGASGAFGVLVAIGAIITGIIPPVCNLEEPDPEYNVSLVSKCDFKYEVKLAMVNAFAFGGTNVVILCKQEEPGDNQ
jgi:3-oxoacyl-(acyl-carrier-protein) synthase